jgi:hypothetical protein
MKFLKRYSESVLSNDIEEFCNDYLPFLKDNGFIIVVNDDPKEIYLTLYKYKNERIKWVDIKDDFLPFIELFSKRYKIEYNIITFMSYLPVGKLGETNRFIKAKDIVNISDDATFTTLYLKVIR